MTVDKGSLPIVKLTQQDFISTFPWGLTGDRVRIVMQETENMLLDAESAAAMAVMLGSESFSARLDIAWKTYLNSQNHDIHVCSQEQAGIDWCHVAMPMAENIRDDAAGYIAKALGADVRINALSWNRKDANDNVVPSFGYAAKALKRTKAELAPWTDWFCAGDFAVKVADNGTLKIKVGDDDKAATVGNLTVEVEGAKLDSRNAAPVVKNAVIDSASKKAYVTLAGQLSDIAYQHDIVVTHGYIDYTTQFDYGQEGTNFGTDIKDIELEPRRTHYFQHERKLCMNFGIDEKNAQFLYNSPYLTWPAAADAHSVESLHYVALQGKEYGLAHMNIGQCAYARDAEDSHGYHVLGFSPNDYIYGRPNQIKIRGKHVHHFRFVPYGGDWRKAGLTQQSNEFNREMFAAKAGRGDLDITAASLIKVHANSTIATALFEREGDVYVRLVEWAGQKDNVELAYGGKDSVFTDCTHALEPIEKLDKCFGMRPWEIKTIRIEGKAAALEPDCCDEIKLTDLPSGWDLKNLFECKAEKINPPAKDGNLYFVSGYHDGFVRPLERHTDTMDIEMERTKVYEGYSNSWEIGASCFVRMQANEPEYLDGLKSYLNDGSIEITGGTWCEPFSLIVSGESNMRQMFYGIKTFRDLLDYQITIYNNQEHATYAQMPQILRSFGLYVVINRTQWAPFGYESAIDTEVANWVGPDGTTIWVVPRYHSMDYKNCPWDDSNLQNGSVTGHNRVWRTEEKFEQMRTEALEQGVAAPLMTMIEDIWSPALRTTDEEMEFYSSLPKVKLISFAKYLEMFGIYKEDN